MIKQVLLGMAGVLSFGAAHATDVHLGDITGSIFPPSAIGKPKNLLGFEDRYFFSVNTPSVGSATVADFQVASANGGLFWNIDNLMLELFDDFGTVGVQDASDVLVNMWSGDFIQATGAPLPAGNFFIRVTGVANGDFGGVYTWHASALPVPEAETWAMMAMGLGLVGLQLRRRKNAEMIA